jgi:membrane protease subunit HflK
MGRTGGYTRWILRLLFIAYALSGMYVIAPSQVGVLVRLGRVVNAGVRPGIHYALPWPIDVVHRVPVKLIHQLQIDTFYQNPDPNSTSSRFRTVTGLPSYCISGDNNIVTVNFLIKYMIVDPEKYLFSVAESELLLMSASSSSLIHTLAGLSVDEILTYGKKDIERCLLADLKERLDAAGSGLGISFIELTSVSPPQIVQKYFDDVINAGIDRKKMVHQAESYRSEQLADARSQAERLKQESLSYREDRIARAEGEAKRFLSQLAELGRSGEITKKRLYLEFIQALYPELEDVIIVDAEGGRRVINLKVFPGKGSDLQSGKK